MENSPFRKLSPELRNRIYELVLQQDCPIFIFDKDLYKRYYRLANQYRSPLAGASIESEALSLTRVCKEIREECKTMFFHLNEFYIQHRYHSWPYTVKLLRDFRLNLDIENAKALRSIVIWVGHFDPTDENDSADEIEIALATPIFSWKIPEITLKLEYETRFLEADDRLFYHMELQACNMKASLLSEIESVKSEIEGGCTEAYERFMEMIQRELETMLERLPKD